jgi:tetratricopeptide (TPR) repeat protein
MDYSYLEGYSNGGWLMESLGDNKNAEAFYRLGVRRNPDRSFMGYQLGFFYFNTLHNYPKAVSVMSRVITLKDTSDVDFKLLAYSYRRMHKYKQALAVWKEIKTRFPNSVAVDHNLQEAQAQYDNQLKSNQ